HTRFSRDWSSDVCSSDLKYLQIPVTRVKNYLQHNNMRLTAEQRKRKQSIRMQVEYNSAQFDDFILKNYNKLPAKQIGKIVGKTRSEERRVGKERNNAWRA